MKNPWRLILMELERLLHEETKARTIVHRHVRSVPVKEMGIEAVVKETRLRCAGSDQEIEASVAAWRWGESLATISAEAQMWRYVRLNTALQFWQPLIELHLESPALGDPLLSPENFVRWLLQDWWHVAGVPLRSICEMGH